MQNDQCSRGSSKNFCDKIAVDLDRSIRYYCGKIEKMVVEEVKNVDDQVLIDYERTTLNFEL